jgi:hypothetical protein
MGVYAHFRRSRYSARASARVTVAQQQTITIPPAVRRLRGRTAGGMKGVAFRGPVLKHGPNAAYGGNGHEWPYTECDLLLWLILNTKINRSGIG